jgi:putative PIN family toxin of toxin-antitoxin system
VRRFFLDANVIFTAAHNPDGNSRALVRLAAQRQLELVSSRYALEEAARNIAVKFPECVTEFNTLISGLLLVAEPSQAEIQLAATRCLPDKDVPILAAAIAARAAALVTGDRRDFGHLYGTTVEGVAILTPAEAVSNALSSRVAK